MTSPAPGDGEVPAPDAETLEGLPPDDWSTVLRAVRAALQSLRDEVLTTRMRQLRAVPVSRLVSGRSRRDLCRLLASEALLWRETVRHLREEGGAGALPWLFSGEEPPAAADEPAEESRPEPDGPDPRDEEIERLRDRSREFREQRDDARRRADGLEGRLRTERSRIEELETELADLREERDALRDDVERADQERRDAIERQRRRYEAELDDQREELRRYRRREQERRQRHRSRQEASDRARQRAREEIAAYRADRGAAGRQATPGRPSRLPPGVSPGTTEAVDLLLRPPRHVYVDGYNVTKQHRGSADLEHQRGWLVRVLDTFGTTRGLDLTVVFDGDPHAVAPSMRSRRVRVDFTRGESADDRLVTLIDDLPPDAPAVVVTDDRELRQRLERRSVDVVPTRPFVSVIE